MDERTERGSGGCGIAGRLRALEARLARGGGGKGETVAQLAANVSAQALLAEWQMLLLSEQAVLVAELREEGKEE